MVLLCIFAVLINEVNQRDSEIRGFDSVGLWFKRQVGLICLCNKIPGLHTFADLVFFNT